MEKEKKQQKQEKQQKQKEKKEYSLFSNYWFLYKGFFRNSKWNILFIVMILVGGVFSYYLRLYIPKVAVALVMEQVSVQKLLGGLLGIELAYFLFDEVQRVGYSLISNPGLKYRHVLEEKILNKICRTVYSNLEDPDYKNKIGRAQHLYLHWDRDARQCIWSSLNFVRLLITVPITSGLMVGLHPILVAVLMVGAWLQYRVEKRPLIWEKKHIDLWQPLERKITYITERLGNFSYAKELRLYAADKWLLPKYAGMFQERRHWMKKQRRQEAAVTGVSMVIETFSQAMVYGFLIRGVLTGSVKPDDFVLYVGLAMSLSRNLLQIANALKDIREKEWSVSDYRRMMNMPDSRVRREEEADPVSERRVRTNAAAGLPAGKAPGITFSHVSFAYQGAEEDTLKDVDIDIRPGEKVALVGLNGAGKTTLIKLLCGMYEPTKGEILLDGKPSTGWPLEEWYKFFSVVFQDIGVIPATILENVAACAPEEADRERVWRCLEQAGLKSVVENLPHGMDTYLQKEMFREGVNLSGGETQKLLLARAIYREAPILVLDEPTAALDAIAENQLYLRYSELTRGRTSLFISHRLSSTRFCDRILMLEGGRIVEQGSHDELMEKKGIYYQLFQIQSHYYQNDRTEDFSSDMDPAWEVSSYVSN